MNEPKGTLGRLARLYTGLEDRLFFPPISFSIRRRYARRLAY